MDEPYAALKYQAVCFLPLMDAVFSTGQIEIRSDRPGSNPHGRGVWDNNSKP